MRKIGILGGTFNPIHYGHLIMAETAYEDYTLDEVWIMPNSDPQYKEIEGSVTGQDRIHMVELAIASNPHFRLSKLEFEREGATYTADTLRILTKRYPEDEFYFILGADSLFQIESWKEYTTVLRLCHIVAASRHSAVADDIDHQIAYLNEKYHADIKRLWMPDVEISSNMIRERIMEGQSVRYLLPDEVIQYSKERGFYAK
ncbi:MAG: nicotinate-nucleotide adenylyltransferase [Lachnospiraceae bacterium]